MSGGPAGQPQRVLPVAAATVELRDVAHERTERGELDHRRVDLGQQPLERLAPVTHAPGQREVEGALLGERHRRSSGFCREGTTLQWLGGCSERYSGRLQ